MDFLTDVAKIYKNYKNYMNNLKKDHKYNIKLYRKDTNFCISIYDINTKLYLIQETYNLNNLQIRCLINDIRFDFIKNHYISIPNIIKSDDSLMKFKHNLVNTTCKLEIKINSYEELGDAVIGQHYASEAHKKDKEIIDITEFMSNMDINNQKSILLYMKQLLNTINTYNDSYNLTLNYEEDKLNIKLINLNK